MKTTLLAMVVAGLVTGCSAAGSKIDPAGPATAMRGEAGERPKIGPVSLMTLGS